MKEAEVVHETTSAEPLNLAAKATDAFAVLRYEMYP